MNLSDNQTGSGGLLPIDILVGSNFGALHARGWRRHRALQGTLMDTVEIESDFHRDWIEYLRTELNAAGFPTLSTATDDEVKFRYFNILKRRIEPMKRVVLVSSELTCPAERRAGLDLVLEKAKLGGDLNPHRSRGTKKGDGTDALLYDWDIHHLHLGTTLEADGFVNRSGPVLFARITKTHFYAIDVMPHGAWADQRAVTILHGNWPDSIADKQLKGVSATPFSNKEIADLRKRGMNYVMSMPDGTVYAPMGGGYSTSLGSVAVVMMSDRLSYHIDALEDVVRKEAANIKLQAEAAGLQLPKLLKLKLTFDTGVPVAIGLEGKLRIPLSWPA